MSGQKRAVEQAENDVGPEAGKSGNLPLQDLDMFKQINGSVELVGGEGIDGTGRGSFGVNHREIPRQTFGN